MVLSSWFLDGQEETIKPVRSAESWVRNDDAGEERREIAATDAIDGQPPGFRAADTLKLALGLCSCTGGTPLPYEGLVLSKTVG